MAPSLTAALATAFLVPIRNRHVGMMRMHFHHTLVHPISRVIVPPRWAAGRRKGMDHNAMAPPAGTPRESPPGGTAMSRPNQSSTAAVYNRRSFLRALGHSGKAAVAAHLLR